MTFLLRRPVLAGLPIALLFALALAGCGDAGSAGGTITEDLSPAGPKRAFAMGFSAFPDENSSEAYQRTFEQAGTYGEIILIQRPVPWSEFITGSLNPSKAIQDTTRLETTLAQRNGLDIAIAVDVTDPRDRHRLAPLPDELKGKNFGSEEVQRAYLTYVRYMAASYRPKYMALAVDVNLLYGGNQAEFSRFLPVYRQAYDIVKEVSPDTRVFATFQYEDLLGQIPWNTHDPDWELLDQFGNKLDIFAISTYPSLLATPVQELPEDYYTRASEHTSLPVAIMDMGYSSGPGAGGVNVGSEAEQARFLLHALGAADRLGMLFVIWYAESDPKYVLTPPLDAYASIGLRATDGKAKAAWAIWIQNFRRPYGESARDEPVDAPRRRNPIATVITGNGSGRPDERDPFQGTATARPTPSATGSSTPTPTGTPGGARTTPTPIS